MAGTGGTGTALADLPSLPQGWPIKMAIGHDDSVRSAAQLAQQIGAGGITHIGYAGDASAKLDWSHQAGQRPRQFVVAARRAGLLPFINYYEIRTLGRHGSPDDANVDQLKRALANPKLMAFYWANAKKLLVELGSSRGPVALSLEPSVWALLEQDLEFTSLQVSDLPVSVSSSGLPELKGPSDDLSGFVDAWRALRNMYAPKVLLGACLDFYGTNLDLAKTNPTHATLVNAARRQALFLLRMSQMGAMVSRRRRVKHLREARDAGVTGVQFGSADGPLHRLRQPIDTIESASGDRSGADL